MRAPYAFPRHSCTCFQQGAWKLLLLGARSGPVLSHARLWLLLKKFPGTFCEGFSAASELCSQMVRSAKARSLASCLSYCLHDTLTCNFLITAALVLATQAQWCLLLHTSDNLRPWPNPLLSGLLGLSSLRCEPVSCVSVDGSTRIPFCLLLQGTALALQTTLG